MTSLSLLAGKQSSQVNNQINLTDCDKTTNKKAINLQTVKALVKSV